MNEPTSQANSESVFREISTTAKHPKTVAALMRIKGACEYLQERRIEISVAEVGVLCKETGPALQSIHNNRKFKAYIELRRAEQKIPLQVAAQSKRFLSKDPDTQAIFDALEAEARREKKRNSNLKRALQLAGVYDFEKTMQLGHLVRVDQTEQTANSQLAVVLRRLFSPEHLRRFGLERIGDRVIAPNRNGRVFIEKTDFEVLWQVATSASSADGPDNS